MRKLVVVACMTAMMGCTAGSEMRPRGRRNSVKIEALEKRITTLEAQIATMSKELAALHAVNPTAH